MSDYHLNLDNVIRFQLEDKYLPVRVMTANMGFMGDVAIVGCNRELHQQMGNIVNNFFEISEYKDTEYFVFPHSSLLYDELKRKLFAYEAWMPNKNQFYSTIGEVFGKTCVIHIDVRWR